MAMSLSREALSALQTSTASTDTETLEISNQTGLVSLPAAVYASVR